LVFLFFFSLLVKKIMKIFWPNKISNKDLHNITNTKDMETLLIQKRWSWLGHVLRKPSEDMTKVVLSIIFFRQVLWKLESLLMSLSVIFQHSEPYRSTDSTQLL
jgi:hypothetical protein